MSHELIISATPEGERIALLADRKILEYHVDALTSFNIGDLYLGVVRKVNPGLNAAFVNIGHHKDAFLHYPDLGEQFKALKAFAAAVRGGTHQGHGLGAYLSPESLPKDGAMADVLDKGDLVPVQIVKEPISSKGYRLSTDLSIPGRHLILVPFGDSINLSKKIEARDERRRLTQILQGLRPEGFGVIVRTAAAGVEAAEIEADLSELMARWEEMTARLAKAQPLDRILSEVGRAEAMVRDLLSDKFDAIQVDDLDRYHTLRRLVAHIAPDRERIVQHYRGKAPLFEASGLERQLRVLFGKTVSLPSGGYLIIEQTEAMIVVDVNSGSSTSKAAGADYEGNSLRVNLEAAREVARQLRLRDIGGIVVVDFIDMRRPEHRKEVQDTLTEAMAGDRAKHTVLPLSKFGIMQITRQRVRPQILVSTLDQCPACLGTGKIQASIGAAELVETALEQALMAGQRGLTLSVHPYLVAYFSYGLPSRQMRWALRYRQWVRLRSDSTLGLTDFRIDTKNRTPQSGTPLPEELAPVETPIETPAPPRPQGQGKHKGRDRDPSSQEGKQAQNGSANGRPVAPASPIGEAA